tara:strand:- start:370 stop:765 length:396 start_codon:yes stop_codon:yes gene_type:complete
MLKLKELLTEWNDTSFKDLPKRWSKPVMKGTEPDGLTEFERLGGIDVELGKVYTDSDRPPFKTSKQIQNEAPMSDTKKGFLMLKIWGQSWSVNMGKVFKGVNREKPAMIKKGLKELKILHKKIEEQIEDLI